MPQLRHNATGATARQRTAGACSDDGARHRAIRGAVCAPMLRAPARLPHAHPLRHHRRSPLLPAAALPSGADGGSDAFSEGLRRRRRGGGRDAANTGSPAGGSPDAAGPGPGSSHGIGNGGGSGSGGVTDGVLSGSLAALAANLDSVTDTNALQTALAAAISHEDFRLAAAVRDRLRQLEGRSAAAGRIDWEPTGMPDWLADRARRLGYRFPTEVQRRSAPVLLSGCDAVIRSATGSGKTLAFLAPLLGRLTYPPDMFLDQMKGPQALILVPSMELGVQAALTAFRLLGGTISAGRPGDEANMFTYFGPKGIKVRGILNKEEVVMAKSTLTYLNQVHLVVATPAAAMEVARGPDPVPLLKHLKVLAVDEVDECFSLFPADMEQLMAAAADAGGRGNSFGEKPQVVLVGATQREDVLERAVELGWLRDPVSIQVGRENTIPPALSHRYIVVPAARRLAALASSLRADLAAADADAAPARVVLFANSPAEAAAVAEPLRNSLWAEHRLAVLVPPGTILGPDAASDKPVSLSPPSSSSSSSSPSASSSSSRSSQSPSPSSPFTAVPGSRSISGGGGAAAGGGGGGGDGGSAEQDADSVLDDMFAYNPIRALHSFRDHKSSLLLASGGAARGLDLPAVSGVYNLGPPPDATQYLHRAGRAGRIGSTAGGVVTTLVSPEEEPALLAIAAQLGLSLERREAGRGPLLLPDLPRLAAPEEDGEEEEEEQGAAAEGDGRRRPPEGGAAGGEEAGKGAGGELGDVERLRRGLEDLFNLM